MPVFGLLWRKRRRQRRKENLSRSKMSRTQSAGKNSKILSSHAAKKRAYAYGASARCRSCDSRSLVSKRRKKCKLGSA